jgi:hypothetical protein
MGRAAGGGTGGGLSRDSGEFGDGFTETDLVVAWEVILARKKLQKVAKKDEKLKHIWTCFFFHKLLFKTFM